MSNSKITWVFRLNNGGSCGSFMRIHGVRQTHLFISADGPGFTLRGEGTPEDLARISDDIFSVNQARRFTITLRVEVPDSTALTARIEGLEAANNELVNELEAKGIKLARIEGELAMLKLQIPNPFRTKPAPKPTTLNVGLPSEGDDAADVDKTNEEQLYGGFPADGVKEPGPELTPAQKRLNTMALKKQGVTVPKPKRKRQSARA